MSSSDKTYYAQVDGLRCIAIVAVMLEHFIYIGVSRLYVGFFGVDLFFVLSGFLITEILYNKKLSSRPQFVLKNFYVRRALRIFPIYYLICVFFLITLPSFKPVAPYAFLYVLNWAQFFTMAPVPIHVSHFWSLAIEEQFYLLWPFIILLVPDRFLLNVFIVIIIGSLFCRVYTDLDHITPSRLYELCAGGLLAFYKITNGQSFKETIVKIKWYPIVLSALVFSSYPEFGVSVLSLWLVYLAVTDSFSGRFKTFLSNKIVIHIGRVSYGIYVYHKLVAFTFNKYIFYPWWNKIDFSFFPVLKYHAYILRFPACVLLSVIVATLSYKYFELPILRLKARFE